MNQLTDCPLTQVKRFKEFIDNTELKSFEYYYFNHITGAAIVSNIESKDAFELVKVKHPLPHTELKINSNSTDAVIYQYTSLVIHQYHVTLLNSGMDQVLKLYSYSDGYGEDPAVEIHIKATKSLDESKSVVYTADGQHASGVAADNSNDDDLMRRLITQQIDFLKLANEDLRFDRNSVRDGLYSVHVEYSCYHEAEDFTQEVKESADCTSFYFNNQESPASIGFRVVEGDKREHGKGALKVNNIRELNLVNGTLLAERVSDHAISLTFSHLSTDQEDQGALSRYTFTIKKNLTYQRSAIETLIRFMDSRDVKVKELLVVSEHTQDLYNVTKKQLIDFDFVNYDSSTKRLEFVPSYQTLLSAQSPIIRVFDLGKSNLMNVGVEEESNLQLRILPMEGEKYIGDPKDKVMEVRINLGEHTDNVSYRSLLTKEINRFQQKGEDPDLTYPTPFLTIKSEAIEEKEADTFTFSNRGQRNLSECGIRLALEDRGTELVLDTNNPNFPKELYTFLRNDTVFSFRDSVITLSHYVPIYMPIVDRAELPPLFRERLALSIESANNPKLTFHPYKPTTRKEYLDQFIIHYFPLSGDPFL